MYAINCIKRYGKFHLPQMVNAVPSPKYRTGTNTVNNYIWQVLLFSAMCGINTNHEEYSFEFSFTISNTLTHIKQFEQ